MKEEGIPWPGWHDFRHGLATSLYELGADGKTRQSILRRAMTENVYTQPVSEVSKAAMAQVERAFNVKLKQALSKKRRSKR